MFSGQPKFREASLHWQHSTCLLWGATAPSICCGACYIHAPQGFKTYLTWPSWQECFWPSNQSCPQIAPRSTHIDKSKSKSKKEKKDTQVWPLKGHKPFLGYAESHWGCHGAVVSHYVEKHNAVYFAFLLKIQTIVQDSRNQNEQITIKIKVSKYPILKKTPVFQNLSHVLCFSFSTFSLKIFLSWYKDFFLFRFNVKKIKQIIITIIKISYSYSSKISRSFPVDMVDKTSAWIAKIYLCYLIC